MKPEKEMTQIERTEWCFKNTPHKLSVPCIRSRIARGWTNQRIVDTPAGKVYRPGANHPFKRVTYNRVARKKGWEETPE